MCYLLLMTAAAAASAAAGAAGGGTADALFAVFLGFHHITDGTAQNHSHNGNNNQIFHNLLFTFQGLCLGQFLVGLGDEAQDDDGEHGDCNKAAQETGAEGTGAKAMLLLID